MSRYAWEPEAIEDVHARGIEPYEVMRALLRERRVRRWLSDFEYWILGAREMLAGEQKWCDNLLGGAL